MVRQSQDRPNAHELVGMDDVIVLSKADKKINSAFVKQFEGLVRRLGSGDRDAVIIGFYQAFDLRTAADDGTGPAGEVFDPVDRATRIGPGIDHREAC